MMHLTSRLGKVLSSLWRTGVSQTAKRRNRRTPVASFGAESLEPRLLLTVFQNFDSVTAPDLPGGWTTSATGSFPQNWIVVNGGSDTAPNRLFIADVAHVQQQSLDNVYDSEVTSPAFLLAESNRQLIFKHSFNLDADETQYFDGGVLEISIGGGAFQDILDAGGIFVSGGYVGLLSPGGDSPLPNRLAWGGDSHGYITTTVNLPASAIGQNVQLRWRLGADNIVGFDGWSIDSILLTDTSTAVNSINETFDGVTAPALPSGWFQTTQGFIPQNWGTVAGGSDSGANHAFVADMAFLPTSSLDNVYDAKLISPKLIVSEANRSLTFRQSFDFDFSAIENEYFDGGVLEISVDAGDFTDITAAGGTFVAGGYNHAIYSLGSNPLASRQAWAGNSNGYFTTTVELPSSLIGKTVQYQWRFGADVVDGKVGWSIDNVQTGVVDPDNQISEAHLVALNSSTAGNLDTGTDVDLFGFDVTAGQTILFDLDAIGVGSVPDAVLRIFDASGIDIAQSDNAAGAGTEGSSNLEPFLSFTFPTGGRYYAGVSGMGNTAYDVTTGAGVNVSASTGTYTLHIGPAPSVVITMSDTDLKIGETSLVTFTFSEPVTGFTNGDLTVENGSLSTVSSGDGGTTFTGTFTPGPNVTDTTNRITINNAAYTDAVGNPGSGTTSSPNFAIDTTRPQVVIVVADTSLEVGETSLVTITFTEPVTGFSNTDITVENGTLSVVSTADGGTTFTGTFIPNPSVTAALNRITVNNTLYTDLSGNLGQGITISNNYAIDTQRPTVVVTMSDTSLVTGETSLVTFTFSEPVTGFTNADITVQNGTLSAVSTTNGGTTFTGTFTPNTNVTDASNLITVNNAGYTDLAGNAGTGTTSSPNFTINTQGPTVLVTMSDTALKVGETSLVTFTFSDPVTGFSNTDITVENGTLSAVSTVNGGLSFTGTFTPNTNVTDASNLITVNNAGYTDTLGNPGFGTTSSPNYAIDTQRPTVVITLSDVLLIAGKTALVTFTFSEPVTAFTNGDLTVENGSFSTVSSGDGGTTFTGTFTPNSNVSDTTNVITVNNAGYTDAAGNAGVATTSSSNFVIDTQRPTVVITLADTVLISGETSLVTFTFSEPVTGFTNANITVENGTLSAVSTANGGVTYTGTFTPATNVNDTTNVITVNNAGYTDAAGNAGVATTISPNFAIDTFSFTVVMTLSDLALIAGETSLVTFTFNKVVNGFTNGDVTVENGTLSTISTVAGGLTFTATFTPNTNTTDATNLITVNNAGYTDATGNPGTGTSASPNYTIDTLRPTVTIALSDPTSSVGETSQVTFIFSEPVTGFTDSDVTVENGTLSPVATANGGLSFTATFTPNSNVTDTTNLMTVNNAGYTDLAGNAGTGTTSSANFTIDTQRPFVVITLADTALVAGETSLVTFVFSEAVTGFTNSDVTVENGTLSAVSTSNGGSIFTATFTPNPNVTDPTNLITVNNAGYTDTAGNPGTGTANSSNFTIDTQRPTLVITLADVALIAGETPLVTFTFSEPVMGFTNTDVSVENGTLSPVSSTDGGLTFTARLTPNTNVTDSTNVITVDNTGYTDLAGAAGTGTSSSPNFTIDTARPTVVMTLSDSALIAGETSVVTFTFSEAVTGFSSTDVTVQNGTLSTVSTANGGLTFTGTFTPDVGVTDTTNLLAVINGAYTDLAGNPGSGATTSPNITIDTQRPTVLISVTDTAQLAGETLQVTFVFSEAVTSFENSDVKVENGTLSPVSSTDGGVTFTATFTPDANVTDTTNLITVNNLDYTDLAGNAGTGTANSPNFTIDTLRPSVVITMTDTTLSSGETSLVTFTFNKPVIGFGGAVVTVENGSLSAVTSGDGGITFTAVLTPAGGVDDATNVITVNNAAYADLVGNFGVGTSISPNYTVKTLTPTDMTLSNLSVTENASNALVGILSAVGGGGTLTYSIDPGNDGALFTVVGTELRTKAGGLDFEALTNGQARVNVRVTTQAATFFQKTLTIQVLDANDAPVLNNPGGAASFLKKAKQPVSVFPQITVSDADIPAGLGGGKLLLTVNVATNPKGTKAFDSLSLPGVAIIGAGTPQFGNGSMVLEIQLASDISASGIQAFLRGITFTTKGAGLRVKTRTATLALRDAGGLSATLIQTILIF